MGENKEESKISETNEGNIYNVKYLYPIGENKYMMHVWIDGWIRIYLLPLL